MVNWTVLYFLVAVLYFLSFLISSKKRKKKVATILKQEKRNLEEIVAKSDTKLLAIKRIKSSYKLGTLSAIEVYSKVS